MHDRRPNVLFVITDQQRFDHVGFMGNDVVRTPTLDGIAARGTVLERAFVANPACIAGPDNAPA
jgi:arylsulfatase A-like enzyme